MNLHISKKLISIGNHNRFLGAQWSMPANLLFFGPIDLVKTAIAFTRIHQSTYRFEILTLLIKDSYR